MTMLNISDDRLPDVALLRGTPHLHQQRDIHAEWFDDVHDLALPAGPHAFLARYRTLNIGYASVSGNEMAAETAHFFAVSGAKLIIQTGTCRGLQPGVQTGDLIIPSKAAPAEGAATHDLSPDTRLAATSDLLRKAASLVQAHYPYHTGIAFTKSANVAESPRDLERWRKAGYVAVDLETAATFAVTEAFNIQRLAVLYVLDSPLAGANATDSPEDQHSRQTGGEEAMKDVVTRVLDYVEQDGFEA